MSDHWAAPTRRVNKLSTRSTEPAICLGDRAPDRRPDPGSWTTRWTAPAQHRRLAAGIGSTRRNPRPHGLVADEIYEVQEGW